MPMAKVCNGVGYAPGTPAGLVGPGGLARTTGTLAPVVTSIMACGHFAPMLHISWGDLPVMPVTVRCYVPLADDLVATGTTGGRRWAGGAQPDGGHGSPSAPASTTGATPTGEAVTAAAAPEPVTQSRAWACPAGRTDPPAAWGRALTRPRKEIVLIYFEVKGSVRILPTARLRGRRRTG